MTLISTPDPVIAAARMREMARSCAETFLNATNAGRDGDAADARADLVALAAADPENTRAGIEIDTTKAAALRARYLTADGHRDALIDAATRNYGVLLNLADDLLGERAELSHAAE